MSQADIGNISAGQTGPDFFDNKLEPWRNALHSGHSGTSRPSYVLAGMTWIDTTTNPWIEKLFDGTDDITKGTIDITTNTYTSAGSGAPYTAPTTTVGASITLAEGTTNGTNTAKIKAGDSLGSDITATVVTGGDIVTKATGGLTSAELRAMLTDEGGTGAAIFDSNTGQTLNQPLINGVTDGSNAASGRVGQYIEASLAAGSATSLVSGTAKTVISISLTAGDWDVSGVVYYTTGGTTSTTAVSCATSTVDNTFPSDPDPSVYQYNGATVTNHFFRIPAGLKRYSLSSTTTVYLVTASNFTVSTTTAYGLIRARRVR